MQKSVKEEPVLEEGLSKVVPKKIKKKEKTVNIYFSKHNFTSYERLCNNFYFTCGLTKCNIIGHVISGLSSSHMFKSFLNFGSKIIMSFLL